MPLDDALRICLAYLDESRDRFEPRAVAWHARWCCEAPALTLAEAGAALRAVGALAGPSSEAIAGAKTLRALSLRHGLEDVAAELGAWVSQRSPGV